MVRAAQVPEVDLAVPLDPRQQRQEGAAERPVPVFAVVGPVRIRAFDHQGTAPLWTGKAAWDDKLKIGVLQDIVKLQTEGYLPSEDEVKKSRQ